MGLSFGVILAFIGIGLLIFPFAFSLGVANRISTGDSADDVAKHKRSLHAAAAFIGIAAFVILISIILIWVFAEDAGKKKCQATGGKQTKQGEYSKFIQLEKKNPELKALLL